uniref:Uncharacterized protein n=1 Tax=Ailuropoda melanoleuca TaxID=9646 RepID=A0A7N5JPP6_AILME
MEGDRFLIIRNHRTTVFTEAKEWSTVFRLKRLLEGLKQPPMSSRSTRMTRFKALHTQPFSGLPSCPLG